MIVDSNRLGAGEEAADDRGRPHRARPRRRQCRSRRHGSISSAATARRVLERPRPGPALGAAGGGGGKAARRRTIASTGIDARPCLPGSRRAQPRQWQLRARQWPRRRRRADLVAGARALHRRRRTDRHGGAAGASCWRRRSRRTISSATSPIRSRTPKKSRSTAARWRCARRRKRTLHAITLSEAPMALSPSAETARIFADGLDRRRPRQIAVVESRRSSGATA